MKPKLRLSRRALLAGTSRLAFLAWAGPLVACRPEPVDPWFDDGTDWVD